MVDCTNEILTMLKSLPGREFRWSFAFSLSQILTSHILGIVSAITLGINTSQISSIKIATLSLRQLERNFSKTK